MPKKGEKASKLRALGKGQGVKPPKKWWDKMMRATARQYPTYGKKRKSRIVGGIWSGETIITKKKIVKENQR